MLLAKTSAQTTNMSTTKNPRDLTPATTPHTDGPHTSDRATLVSRALTALQSDIDKHSVTLSPLVPVNPALVLLDSLPVVGRDHLLAAIIREPAAVALLLRAANSRYLDPVTGGIVSVEMATGLVGERGIRDLLQYLDLQAPARWAWDAAPQHLRRMWTNTIYSALTAQKLAMRHGGVSPDLAFSTAMVRNIGAPLLVQYISREFERTDQEPAANQDRIHANNEEIGRHIRSSQHLAGSRLLRSWNLPEPIVQVALNQTEAQDDILTATVTAAWYAALRYGYVYLGAAADNLALERTMRCLSLPMATLDAVTLDIASELNAILTQQN